MHILHIVSLVLALAGIVLMFVPRFPAVLAAYVAMLLTTFSPMPLFGGDSLAFWGVATVIVLGLRVIQSRELVSTPAGHAYVGAGALAGAVVGLVSSPTSAALTLGAAVGAFAGAMAWNRTPGGPHMPVGSRLFVDYFASKGLPAVVSAVMSVEVVYVICMFMKNL